MGPSLRLETRQAQVLALTPQLLQSIRVLQLDRAELAEFLRREAERNPLLSLVERGGRRPASPAAAFEATDTGAVSLPAHALAEIADILSDPQDRQIASALLGDLDEAGYLRVDLEAASLQLNVPAARLAALLRRLRGAAEPAGLFAGDLAQCLTLQLERRGRLDPFLALLLSRLDLLARADLPALRRLSGRSADDIADALRTIRQLDPKPGRRFGGGDAPLPEPDIIVAPVANGGWRVALNGNAVPRLALDEDYARTIGAAQTTAAERAYLTDCRSSAGWLLRALDQRARSVLKVASHVMGVQEGFLAQGVHALKPLTLAGVASAVGLHESSVSRAVANKTILTPRGLFELRFFFSAALASSAGDGAHAATGVRGRIRRLIAAEEPGSVLSDEAIVALLHRDGITVARRTVAKYREALGIPGSARRRREQGLRLVAS